MRELRSSTADGYVNPIHRELERDSEEGELEEEVVATWAYDKEETSARPGEARRQETEGSGARARAHDGRALRSEGRRELRRAVHALRPARVRRAAHAMHEPVGGSAEVAADVDEEVAAR